MEDVTIEKLVHGGQGLGTLADGRKVFVWNALPGERLRVRLTSGKKSYAEGFAEEVLAASADRIEPAEEMYLSTSPWQVMTFQAENRYKAVIARELMSREKVSLPDPARTVATVHDGRQWQYRSKMEYSFWGDDDGLHLALYGRGTHGKRIVTGSRLAMPAVDAAANAVLQELRRLDIRAGDLKTIIVRCSQDGTACAALFVKPQEFPEIALPAGVAGLRVYHSNPKSPASVATRLLSENGNNLLHDRLSGQDFIYDADSFFQVNLPVFELALQNIKDSLIGPSVTDMYSGVGSIGLTVAAASVNLVELDPASVRMASQNAAASRLDAAVIEASTEKALEYVTHDVPVIFDPPRAGLHAKVVGRVLDAKPPQVIYLSCNPATQARDLKLLDGQYTISHFGLYNFFPRTPHIETLAVLTRND